MSREIRSMKDPSKRLEILEAGCGPRWYLDIGDGGHVLTGIDLDPEALRVRRDETKDLHEAVVGDLRTADFGHRTFDVIFSSFVLEHVPGAQQVLENFNRWVKPGGLIIIMIPDPYSAHGFTARMTPHWIHLLYYRLIRGQKNAGKPGYGPYPVTYDKAVSREGIRAFCAENGLVLAAEYGMLADTLKNRPVEAYMKTLQVLSLGRLSSDHSDIIFIIRKPALPARADLQVSAALPACCAGSSRSTRTSSSGQ
ncbi:class I SAM-dependent methyltransferase [Bradyrhizobium valentinum]|nr:class I SAM-dependent methyltransferase [Bradyrhizobium valentinum]